MIGKIAEEYLEWIRRQECVAPSEFAGGTPCGGGIQPHHTTGRGMGGEKRDDRDAVPLCRDHHIFALPSVKGLAPWDADDTKANLAYHAHRLLKEYLDELLRQAS